MTRPGKAVRLIGEHEWPEIGYSDDEISLTNATTRIYWLGFDYRGLVREPKFDG